MSKPKFSANLGFLWKELPFIERIDKAGQAGFKAIEFHDQARDGNIADIKAVLEHHDLRLMSLNVKMDEGFGKAALPGQEEAARRDIDEAAAIAEHLNADAIHVLSGCTTDAKAVDTFVDNLGYALENTSKRILIEPISVVPGYFLNSLQQAVQIIDRISHPRLKIMFDCFHIRHALEDLNQAFLNNVDHIGHVQISSFPDRQEPEDGVLEYSILIPEMIEAGYGGWFGCEYNPEGTVESGLGWMQKFQ